MELEHHTKQNYQYMIIQELKVFTGTKDTHNMNFTLFKWCQSFQWHQVWCHALAKLFFKFKKLQLLNLW